MKHYFKLETFILKNNLLNYNYSQQLGLFNLISRNMLLLTQSKLSRFQKALHLKHKYYLK